MAENGGANAPVHRRIRQEALPWYLFGALVLVALAVAAFRFAAIDRLSTFADDSVSYVLLARCWSPWFDTSQVIQEACAREHYPPMLPLVLALTGASHDYLLAHGVAVSIFLIAVVLLFLFTRQQLRWTPGAVLVAILFACSPLTWSQMLGILSENLYIALSLAVLMLHQRLRNIDTTVTGGLLLGLLLAALILTRAVGVAMLAAIVLAALCGERRRWFDLGLTPVAVAVLVVGFSYAVRTVEGDPLYAEIVRRLWSEALGNGFSPAAWVEFFTPQVKKIVYGWYGIFTNVVAERTSLPALIAALFGISASLACLMRLTKNRLDAWYVLSNLGVLMLIFLPGQFSRFIYALAPVLLFQAAWLLRELSLLISNRTRADSVFFVMLAVPIAAVAPSLAFFYQRAHYQTQIDGMDLTANAEFYRHSDFRTARRQAILGETLFQDIERLRDLTQPDETVLWYTPSFLALLAERRGVRLIVSVDDPESPQAVSEDYADYVFLSKLNPRDTRESVNPLIVSPFFLRRGEVLSSRFNPEVPSELFSLLIRLDRERIEPQ